jgi:coenzyme Q-binding protein COQ10
MPRHGETRILPYPADLMYAVVADVERYPEFLPGCHSLDILSRIRTPEGEALLAEMRVGFKTFSGSYVSRVVLNPAERRIDVVQERGPFRRLENRWRFAPAGKGTKVDFFIAFDFRNLLLNAAAAAAFEPAVHKLSAAFEARAKAMTGVRPDRQPMP